MYLRKGEYTHPIGEPQIAISKRPIVSSGGVPVAHAVTWAIQGMLLGSGQADLDAQIAAFTAAYARQNEDVVLLLSDGVTESQHTLKVRDTRGGVYVTQGPDFPQGAGPEYATRRSFAVQISAEVPIAGSTGALMNFTETLSTSGGGPRYSHVETALGFPIKQQLRRATTYHATQSGTATGYALYPSVPPPIFGEANLAKAPHITRRSPEWVGNATRNFTVSWQYQFESALPMFGLPSIAP
ncbi:hypothetical protein C5Y96_10815 [Blastopirellula marina]|uniref:Uncharacterized protein n=1 Tax=Blastopirellula marina TaxID=124 RepID=A0A2S8FME0_9BACT|nr:MULTISPECIES: hypothetical protein [Pirellulaceae]PQO33335.1 hypothetical protein C5Y96_10815 [Blastopirellula marina]RCS52424.1 hypothetical protein DTL36_10825 [Bremerella cremea]